MSRHLQAEKFQYRNQLIIFELDFLLKLGENYLISQHDDFIDGVFPQMRVRRQFGRLDCCCSILFRFQRCAFYIIVLVLLLDLVSVFTRLTSLETLLFLHGWVSRDLLSRYGLRKLAALHMAFDHEVVVVLQHFVGQSETVETIKLLRNFAVYWLSSAD